jgi:hypothetical protein
MNLFGGCGCLTKASVDCMGIEVIAQRRHDSYTDNSIPHGPTRNTSLDRPIRERTCSFTSIKAPRFYLNFVGHSRRMVI